MFKLDRIGQVLLKDFISISTKNASSIFLISCNVFKLFHSHSRMMKRGDSKLEKLTDNMYPSNAIYYSSQPQPVHSVDQYTSITVGEGLGDMEAGLPKTQKSLVGRLWESYTPTVSGLAQIWLHKMENLGEYVCENVIGITRPKYEWECNDHFEQQQGILELNNVEQQKQVIMQDLVNKYG